jgi:FkbM family methyltransferase
LPNEEKHPKNQLYNYAQELTMSFIKKSRTALKILKEQGLKGVFTTIRAKLNRSSKPDETNFVFQVLKGADYPGLMIDVGAHYGSSLAPFAEHGWQVLAFEPDSANRRVLTHAYGTHPNVIIDPRACSDQVQPEVTLFTSAESTGVSGLSAFLESHHATERVPVTTLGVALNDHGLTSSPVDFLKIDTEGFDLTVLKGYRWETHAHPSVILCEFEDTKTTPLGYNFHDLAAHLIKHDYQLIISEWYPIKRYGGTHGWRCFITYPCQLADPQGWGSIIAVKDSSTFKQLYDLCQLD